MNRSFSKIRHIQESNNRLEKRLLWEQKTDDVSMIRNLLKSNGWYTIEEYQKINDKAVLVGRDFLGYDKAIRTMTPSPFFFIRPMYPKGVSNFWNDFETIYIDGKSGLDSLIICFNRSCYFLNKDFEKIKKYITTPYIR